MEFQINEDLTTYSDAEIGDLITQGNAALDAALAVENPTPAHADEAERIAAAIDNLSTEREARVAAAARMETLRASRIEAAADETPTEGDEGDDNSEDAGSEDDNSEDAASEGDNDEESGDDASDENEEDDAVTASGRTGTRGLRGSRPRNDDGAESRGGSTVSITAAADVAGFSMGSDIDSLTDLAVALGSRVRGFPTKPAALPQGGIQRYGVATLSRNFDDEFVADGTNDLDVIDAVAAESRLDGGSLVAAGGWCAPSETIYDLCAGETTEGLLDLPEFQVKRGGVRYTEGPQFSDLYGNGFQQTEAEAIAGTTKDCYEIECPDFEEVRLEANGLCIKVPLLTNAAYPELTRRVISGSLIAYQHKVSADLIADINTSATANGVITAGGVGSVTASALDAMSLIGQTERQRYRLGVNATLEALAPVWLKEVIKSDLAMRTGVDLLAVTDAQINAYFAARNIRVQWLYNWQDLGASAVGWPTTVSMIVYPAGTFQKGVADVINLDAVYDSASLQVNTMTGLFFEEGILLLQKCWRARKITFPVCAAGITGAANNVDCATV